MYLDRQRAAAPSPPPSAGTDPSSGGSLISALIAAVVAVPLIGMAVIVSNIAKAAGRDADEARDQVARADMAIAGPIEVLAALDDERAAAYMYLTGMEGTAQLDLPGTAEARLAVDRAVASLRVALHEQGGDIAETFAPALDRAGELAAIRQGVDAVADANRNTGNTEAVDGAHTGYTGLIAAFTHAQERLALTIEEPELRRGATLVRLAAGQSDRVALLVRQLTLAAVDGLDAPGRLATLIVETDLLRDTDQLITSTATGAYRPLAEALYADPALQQLPHLVDTTVETGAVDIAAVTGAMAGVGDRPWGYAAFMGAVTDLLGDQADDLTAGAAGRERRYTVIAGAAMVAAGAAVLVTVVVAVMALRTGDRQGGPPAPTPDDRAPSPRALPAGPQYGRARPRALPPGPSDRTGRRAALPPGRPDGTAGAARLPPDPGPKPDRWPPDPGPKPDRWPPDPGPEPDRWPPDVRPEPDRWPPDPGAARWDPGAR